MSLTQDTVKETVNLICLFHHPDHASTAIHDLYRAGIPQSSVFIFNSRDNGDASGSSPLLDSIGIPQRDRRNLEECLKDGGTVISVAASAELANKVERIFANNSAKKIDETALESGSEPLAQQDGATIPIVEEELNVGKRTVDQGGVRVYRRIVEIPAEESIALREEHVVVQRNAVDRPATQADLDAQSTRSIELTETAEEAVVGKTARVVEEVLVGKQATDHTQRIEDTVRRTEVEVEELPASSTADFNRRSF